LDVAVQNVRDGLGGLLSGIGVAGWGKEGWGEGREVFRERRTAEGEMEGDGISKVTTQSIKLSNYLPK